MAKGSETDGRVYERCLAGRVEECEEVVAQMVALCPWMGERDVERVRLVWAAHVAMVAGEDVDVGLMAGHLLALGQRAEEAGDLRRAWAFDEWYAWACMHLRGAEYRWSTLPEELAALP